jgi:hypothetical protein
VIFNPEVPLKYLWVYLNFSYSTICILETKDFNSLIYHFYSGQIFKEKIDQTQKLKTKQKRVRLGFICDLRKVGVPQKIFKGNLGSANFFEIILGSATFKKLKKH